LDDDLLVLDRPEVRHLKARLDDVADGIANLDAIANLERSSVRHHVAGNDVRDGR
jgi:hypothetical protein